MGFSEIGQRPLKPETHLSNAMMTQSAPHTVGWSKRLQSWWLRLHDGEKMTTSSLEELVKARQIDWSPFWISVGLPVGLQQIPKNQKKNWDNYSSFPQLGVSPRIIHVAAVHFFNRGFSANHLQWLSPFPSTNQPYWPTNQGGRRREPLQYFNSSWSKIHQKSQFRTIVSSYSSSEWYTKGNRSLNRKKHRAPRQEMSRGPWSRGRNQEMSEVNIWTMIDF